MGKDSQQTCEELAQQYRILLEVSKSIAAYRDLRALFHNLAQRLHRVVRFEQMWLIPYGEKGSEPVVSPTKSVFIAPRLSVEFGYALPCTAQLGRREVLLCALDDAYAKKDNR